jgi:ArsR family transcriptional regulator
MAQGMAPTIINWMQSLSDQTRTRLLRILQRQELTVAEICSVVQLPQSTVSRHLRILADDRWLGSRKDGTANLYRMDVRSLDPAQSRLWTLVIDQSVESEHDSDTKRLTEVIAARRSRSQAFFSTAHDQWDQIRSELFGSRLDAAAIAALIEPTHTIGDLGCGTAAITQQIAPWVKKVVAVDSSAAMLKSARQRLGKLDNVELRRGELIELPVDSGELDIALLLLVLPYVESPDQVLAQAARATRKSGRLVIVDMLKHQRTNYREDLGHTWLGFEEKQLRDWLTEAGWRPQRWQPLCPDPDAKGPELFVMTAIRTS